MNNLKLAVIILISFLSCDATSSADPSHQPTKKVIEFGWDTPSVQNIHDQIETWQDRPFDGLIFSFADGGGKIFNVKSYNPATLLPQIDLLRQVRWGRFTDNFIQLTCASDMDWASDSDWKIILAHADLCARAAQAGGCLGFAFDPEHYGGINPWNYPNQQQKSGYSFAQYEAFARERGKEFAKVLQARLPNMKFLMLYQYSELVNEIGPNADQAAREQALSSSYFGLMPSFLDGMLEVAGPNVEFIDGNERSYWYTNEEQFQRSYQTIHDEAQIFVSPELRKKFRRQERAAQAVYVDYNFNLQSSRFPKATGVAITKEQRAELFESDLYYGLKSSDEYVWVYGENMNWWTNPPSVPPGITIAINDAKAKANSSQSLGYDTTLFITGTKLHNFFARLGL